MKTRYILRSLPSSIPRLIAYGLIFLLFISPALLAKGPREKRKTRPPARSSFFQGLEVIRYTEARDRKFFDNSLDYQELDPSVTNYNYAHMLYRSATKIKIRYYHVFLLAEFLHGRVNGFTESGERVIHETEFQGAIRPEFHFKWRFVSLGVGYKIHFGSGTELFSHWLNNNSPYISLVLDQKVFRLPLHLHARGTVSPQLFAFDSKTIYSISGALRIDFTYYLSLTVGYTKQIQKDMNISDNIVDFHFDYRFTPAFAASARYSRLVYSDDRFPFNEFGFGLSYFHNFKRRNAP